MLQAAIQSLENLDTPDDCSIEVIVVDNASIDGAADWAAASGYRTVRLARNEGFARAVNRGIDLGCGDDIVVMNDDVELAPDWLVQITRALKASEQAWFACGKTLCYADRGRIDGAGDAICRGGASWRIGHGRKDSPQFDIPRQTYFPSGTATLFRRDFFDEVGRFDEDFFAYLEDVDLGLRAVEAGLGGIYVPEARAYHHGSRTGHAWSPSMVRWITAHQILLLAKHYPAQLLFRYGWNILVAQLLWAAMAMSRGRVVAWMRGMASGLKHARQSRYQARGLREKADRLPEVLSAMETEIVRLQQETGFDGYWRWYFRLVRAPARDEE